MVKITLISLLLLVKIALNIINLGASKESKVYFNAQSIPNKIEYSNALFKMKPRNNALKIISKGDILISEVLFNPRNGGVDFVEIYNNSNHEIDLKELQLANANTAGEPASIKNISLTKLMIAPKTYWVITSNQANIKLNYEAKFPFQFVQLTSLPAYSNDKGSVILLSSNQVVDRLNYNAKIHHPLIQNEDGISIERVSFEMETNDPNNFKSAAATVGFATPTYKNSQEFNGEENFVNLQSKTFSPDGDGFEDFLTLDYQLAENSSLATVNVFSDQGKLVRKLLVNQTIATKGNLNWDGLNDQGTSCGIGIYIVLFDVFDLKGNTKRFKNTCVLAGKLN